MSFFRKRPIVVEAIQFTGSNLAELAEFTGYRADDGIDGHHDMVVIETLEGDMEARVGCWIIKGVTGECYPCQADIFETTYERVDDSLEVTDTVAYG